MAEGQYKLTDAQPVAGAPPVTGGGKYSLANIDTPPATAPKPGFLDTLWQRVGGPVLSDAAHGVMGDKERAQKAIDALKAMGSSVMNEGPRIMSELDHAGDALAKGDWDMVMHHIAGAAPLVGPGIHQFRKDREEGNDQAAAADVTALLLPFAAAKVPGLARAVADTDAGAAVIGGAKGAAKAAVEIKKLNLKGMEFPVPVTVASGAAGGQAATMMGLPRSVGTVVGAGAPVVRGAVQGARAALAERVAAAAAKAKAATVRQPLWQELKDSPSQPPQSPTFVSQQPPMGMDLDGNMRPGPLPSGRRVGPAPPREAQTVEPPAPSPVQTQPEPVAGGGKTAADLLQEEFRNKTQPVAAVAPAEDMTLLDEIAQGQVGKPFAKLNPAHQTLVRELARRLNQQTQPVAPQATQLVATPTPQPVSADPTNGLGAMMQGLPPEMQKAIADANFRAIKEGNADPATAGPVYDAAGIQRTPQERAAMVINRNRTSKGAMLGKALHDGGITLEEAKTMDAGHWKMLADSLGVRPPEASIPGALAQLEQLEKAAKAKAKAAK